VPAELTFSRTILISLGFSSFLGSSLTTLKSTYLLRSTLPKSNLP
jgi:hypothetical protein